MQEQEGERRGVGEKNKRRTGDERGASWRERERRRKRKKVRRVTLLRKACRERKIEEKRAIKEKERDEKEISRIFYIRGYPCLILMRLCKKQNPIIKEYDGYNRKEAKPFV